MGLEDAVSHARIQCMSTSRSKHVDTVNKPRLSLTDAADHERSSHSGLFEILE